LLKELLPYRKYLDYYKSSLIGQKIVIFQTKMEIFMEIVHFRNHEFANIRILDRKSKFYKNLDL